ncbi:MAG: hypothetical protein RSH52_34660, partial [Janthinobacterium sp.]
TCQDSRSQHGQREFCLMHFVSSVFFLVSKRTGVLFATQLICHRSSGLYRKYVLKINEITTSPAPCHERPIC